MWFQTLKARQGIRHFITANSKGQAAAIEYNDKKVEVHLLKREATPLLLDEGSHVAFLAHKNSAMSFVSLLLTVKNGKVQLEFRAWDIMGALGFTPKDILVEDMSKCYINDGKFKGSVTLPEHCTVSPTIKVSAHGEYIAVAVDISLVLLWKGKKTDLNTITLTLDGMIKSQMAVHSICLLPEPNSKQGFVQVLIGEAGGLRVWTVHKDEQDESDVKTEMCSSSFISLPHVDPGGSSVIQDLQGYSSRGCILSDTTGRLWALDLNESRITEIQLPSSLVGHGLFAVQDNADGNNSSLMVVVEKGNTLNLFDLKNIHQSSSSPRQPSSLMPYHTIFSSVMVTSVAFFQPNVLAAGSVANKSYMMWVGSDISPTNSS